MSLLERKNDMDRNVKVYEASVPSKDNWGRSSYRTVTQIRLQRQWLENLGFEPGVRRRIECSGGKLVITKLDEIITE